MKHIVLTGGGTAGHVTPNIAMIPRLKELGYKISYIGSYEGIEKKLIEELGIPYYGISSGKLRRYFDVKNFTDPFRVVKGFMEAKKLMKDLKPDVVFSKGGFVTVPVVIAASRKKIPTFIHESDMTPGLANKICIPFATKVCCNFPETVSHLPEEKAVLTGTPIRQELLTGSREKGLEFTGFSPDKPVILIIGGSLGAAAVNQAVRAVLPELLQDFQVIHLCGKGKIDDSLEGTPGYVQYEYIKTLHDINKNNGFKTPSQNNIKDIKLVKREPDNPVEEIIFMLKKADDINFFLGKASNYNNGKYSSDEKNAIINKLIEKLKEQNKNVTVTEF